MNFPPLLLAGACLLGNQLCTIAGLRAYGLVPRVDSCFIHDFTCVLTPRLRTVQVIWYAQGWVEGVWASVQGNILLSCEMFLASSLYDCLLAVIVS